MQLNLNRRLFLNALSRVVTPASKGGIMPILSNVLIAFDARENEAVLCTTDLELSMSTSVDCLPSESTKILVNARGLHDALKNLEGEDVLTTIDEKSLTLGQGKAKFKFPLSDPEEFPEFQKVDGTAFKVEAGILRSLIGKVDFAISADETRYVLTGMLMEVRGTMMTTVGTDGFRMAVYHQGIADAANTPKIVIPKKTVGEIEHLLPQEGTVVITVEDKKIKIVTAEATIVSRLIEGAYPDYESVVPRMSEDRLIKVDRKEFLKAVRQVSVMANKGQPADFVLKDGQITLKVESDRGDAERVVPVNTPITEPLQLHFNTKFLIDTLTHVEQDEVRMFLPATYGAALIEEGEYKNVIMPVRI